ncbi:18532_t:CDS:1, partial [Gigaspora margarita]
RKSLQPRIFYVQKQHPKLKTENPGLDHKAAFKLVAEAWAKS